MGLQGERMSPDRVCIVIHEAFLFACFLLLPRNLAQP